MNKEKILIFIIGLLVGAVIATGAFYIYTVTTSSNDNPNAGMNGGGQPPEMPNGENGGPPEMPNGGSNQNGQPPEKPDGDNSGGNGPQNSGNSQNNNNSNNNNSNNSST